MPLTLSQSILEGKELAMLGRVQQVSLDSSATGTSTLILKTNNTDYRGSTIVVAYVFCETNTSVAFPAGISISLGVTGNDFLGGAALSLAGQPSGCLAYSQMTSVAAFPVLITYGANVNFVVTVTTIATTAVLGQFSAYGWTIS